ncbi:MAG: hypothetical protein E3K32_01990 [wastewater metagenome]|nr:hypothetical protein [Candidatus Loosdrechtia aerotolerans]
METILKADVLHEKSSNAAGKEKIDKIMDTIIEQAKIPEQENAENAEGKTPQEPVKPKGKADKERFIFSSETIISGEEKADLEEIRNRLTKELKPSNEIELIIVDRIISSIWRLKRCLVIEKKTMEYNASCIQEYEQGFLKTRKRTDEEIQQLKAVKIIEDRNKREELSRYETMLERQIYRALSELDRLRKRESKQERKTARKTKRK